MTETYMNGQHINISYHKDGQADRFKGFIWQNVFPGQNLRVDDKEVTVVAAGPNGIVYIDYDKAKDLLPLQQRLNGPQAEIPGGKDWQDIRTIFVY